MKNYRKVQKIINNEFPELMLGTKMPCGFSWYRKEGITVINCSEEFAKYNSVCPQCKGTDWIENHITLQSLLRYLQETFNLHFEITTIDIENKKTSIIEIWDCDYMEGYLDLSTPPNEWTDEKWREILAIIK